MKSVLKFIKATLIGGLLFLVPVVIFFMAIEKAFKLATDIFTPVVAHFPSAPVLGFTVASIVAAVVLLVLSFLAGIAAQTGPGKQFAEWLERVFLARMPGYVMFRGMVGDMSSTVDSLNANQQIKVVLINLEEAWQIAFHMDTLASGELVVYVPDAPSPVSGSVLFMSPERVRASDLTVLDANSILRRIGQNTSEKLKAVAV